MESCPTGTAYALLVVRRHLETPPPKIRITYGALWWLIPWVLDKLEGRSTS